MITDVGHPAFAAHDMERSLAFYARLGLHESFRLNRPDGSLMLIYVHVAGDRFIELFPGGPAAEERGRSSFMHLCLLTDDIQSMVEQLRQSGVTIDQQPKVGLDYNWQAWLRDPDGNPIELMQLSEESPQRERARRWAAQNGV